jgi:hypothetical protein
MYRPSARLSAFLYGLWVATLAGCAGEPDKLTQIVVVVDSDLPVPDQLDALQIEVTGVKEMRPIDARLDAEHGLPRTLGIVYSGGPLGPVRVSARGSHGGEMIVERMAEVFFARDRTLKLQLPLTRACRDEKPECESDQTCDQGSCVAAAVAQLPMFDGNDGPFLSDAGATADAGSEPAAGSGGGGDGGRSAPKPDAGPDAGARPMGCTIDRPKNGASFYEEEPVDFEGSCTTGEDDAIGVRWRSSLNGTLGQEMQIAYANLSVGMHEITLCVTGKNLCSEPVQINVQALPALSANIASVTQGGQVDGVYSSDAELVAVGEGTGVMPLSYTWLDSFGGEIATGSTCRYGVPVLAGRHALKLIVTDARGRIAFADKSFVVHSSDSTSLFEAYGQVNSMLDGFGVKAGISVLVTDGTYHFIGTEKGSGIGKKGWVVRVAAAAAPAGTPGIPTNTLVTMGEESPGVRDIYLASSTTVYLATDSDVERCTLAPEGVTNCMRLTLPGLTMGSKPRCVRTVNSGNSDFLALGTSVGFWVGNTNMLEQGTLRETDGVFNALTSSTDKLWIASSGGLSGYTLGGGLSGSPQAFDGASDALGAIVAGTDMIWGALPNNGFTCYDVKEKTWTSWTTSYTEALFGRLVSNDVRSVAITHPVINGFTHDVIWLGTSSGLSRFDPGIPSFTTYTKADGLPDNLVQRVLGVANNEVLLATPQGLAIHRGQ